MFAFVVKLNALRGNNTPGVMRLGIAKSPKHNPLGSSAL